MITVSKIVLHSSNNSSDNNRTNKNASSDNNGTSTRSSGPVSAPSASGLRLSIYP